MARDDVPAPQESLDLQPAYGTARAIGVSAWARTQRASGAYTVLEAKALG